MSTSRTLFCDLCVILLFGVTVVLAEEINTKPALQLQKLAEFFKGNCSCGGFPNSEPEVGSEPLLSQSSGLVVNCAEEGQLTCKRMCNALAIATKAKGPEILCNKLKDVNELKLSAFYKVCDKPWIYADITAEEPICCESGVVKICASAEKTNATNIINVKTVM